MVDPTGVPASIDTKIPTQAHTTEIPTEQIVTLRKLRNIRIADNAGNITSAEISSDPTRFIAITITTAIKTASNVLYRFVFIPVALANVSSNVIENILL